MTRSVKVFASVYFLACSFLVSLAAVIPAGDGPVAVFASPWGSSALEVVARTDGSIVHVGNGAWVAVTASSEGDFVARLYQAGAGFVASTAVARACAALSGAPLEKAI